MNIISILSIFFIGIFATSCVGKMIEDRPEKTEARTLSIEEVIKEHSEALMSVPGVVGVGQGLCDNIPCIKVYVNNSSTELDNKIPALLDSYKVSIEVIGELRAHPNN
jgi:hypothetical protein